MPRPDQLQIVPPRNDEDFEKLCRALWAHRYGYKKSESDRIGRKGQEQYGVDIYLHREGIGVQCKKKEGDRPLTQKDFRGDISEALNFSPPLKEFIIATTSKRDARLQKIVWELSESYASKGLFRISLVFWDDILEWLADPEAQWIVQEFLSVGGGNNTSAVLAKDDEILSEVKSIKALLVAENPVADRTSKFHLVLESAKTFIESRHPKAALALLKKHERGIRTKGSDEDRYLLLARMGSAQWHLGHDAKALRYFIEALQYKPDDEKALVNAARACLTAGHDVRARRYIDLVLQKNPKNESAQAVRVNLEPLSMPLAQVIESIPVECRNLFEVAFAISVAARRRRQLKDARYWLEIAQKNNAKGVPEIPAYLGMTIIEQLLEEDPALAHADQLDQSTRSLVTEAEGYLQTAWNTIKDTELTVQKVEWLDTLALAKMLKKDFRRAEEDLSIGLSICPTNKALLLRKAQLAFHQNRPMEAADILSGPSFVDIKSHDDIKTLFLRAAALSEARRHSDARELVSNFLKAHRIDENWDDAAALLIEIVEAANGPEVALKEARELMNVRDGSPFLLSIEAVLLKKLNRKEEALESLSRAKSFLKGKGGKWDVPALADACFRLEKYAEAAGFYEMAGLPLSRPSPPLRRLVQSCMEGGIPDKALAVCRDLRNRFGPLPFYTEAEIHLLAKVNDRPSAVEVLNAYIEKYPNVPWAASLKIFRARLAWDMGKTKDVDAYLDSIQDLSSWDMEDQINIARLFAMRNRIPEALNHFYEIRRRFFHKTEPHKAYISFLLAFEQETLPLLKIEAVGKDTAVCLVKEDGEKKTYVIEDRPAPDPRQGEISVNHSLAKALWNKNKGDKIIWGTSGFSKEPLSIEKIQSKFIYRLHESMDGFESNFPEEKDFLMKVKIDVSKEESFGKNSSDEIEKAAAPGRESSEIKTTGLVPKQFIEIMAKSRSEWAEQLAQIYREGMPLCAVARMAGQSALEVWAGFGQDSGTGVRCAAGTPNELTQALNALLKKPRLVVDMISLRCLLNLELADSVVSHFGRLIVAQSTVDFLRETILERSPMKGKGFLSFGWRDGHLSGVQVTPENIEGSLKIYERDLSWIEKNADIPPAYSRLQFPADKIKQAGNVLGETFLDVILLCREKNRLMLADDLAFRHLAKNDFKVDGVWIQPVVLILLKAGVITKEVYNRTIIHLAKGNYRYLSIDASMLIQSVEEPPEAKWRPSLGFHQIAAFLGGKLTSNEDSAVSVAGEFLYSLWIKPEAVFQRVFLAQAVLSHLIEGRNHRHTLKKLVDVIRLKCRLIPIAERELLGVIQSFSKTVP